MAVSLRLQLTCVTTGRELFQIQSSYACKIWLRVRNTCEDFVFNLYSLHRLGGGILIYFYFSINLIPKGFWPSLYKRQEALGTRLTFQNSVHTSGDITCALRRYGLISVVLCCLFVCLFMSMYLYF